MSARHLLLVDLLARFRPESWAGTRGDTWPEHHRFLWSTEPDYMAKLLAHMRQLDGWFYKPVLVDGAVVQDAHHRIVAASVLGWWWRPIPLERQP